MINHAGFSMTNSIDFWNVYHKLISDKLKLYASLDVAIIQPLSTKYLYV